MTLQVPFPEIAVNIVRQTRFTEEQDELETEGQSPELSRADSAGSNDEFEMPPKDRL